MESSITVKGQTTIPKPVRDHLRLKPGDKVRYFVRADGMVVMLPVMPVTSLRGMLKSDRQPVTVEEMNEAIGAGATAAALPPARS